MNEVSYPAAPLDVTWSGGADIVIPGNAERWCIGFSTALSSPSMYIAPWAGPAAFPFVLLAAPATVWFPMSIYGPIVCAPWYLSGVGPGAKVRVTQILRS